MAIDAQAAARMLRERAQRARAAREGRAAEALRRVEAMVSPLLPEGGRAWLIGSLAWGGFGERSDIDLVTCGVNGVDATRIEDAVTRSLGVSVDLLELEVLPQGFRQRIEREGIPLHGR
jgi:predicted nucleotidyltransferase